MTDTIKAALEVAEALLSIAETNDYVELGFCRATTIRDGLRAAVAERDKALKRVKELEDREGKIIAAYRIECMQRPDYTHSSFDEHVAALKGADHE